MHRPYLGGELQRVGLVKLEDRHVCDESSREPDLGHHRGDDTASEVAAGGVREHGMEFYSVRRIRIKKDMNYRPALRVTFDKTYYNENDTVRLFFSPSSEQGDSLFAEINAILQRGNKKLEKEKTTTSVQGKALIGFHPQ